MKKITGTFLDEITIDIPSNNWRRQEWEEEFRIMKAIGIDTLVMIRSGYKNVAACPSKVLKEEVNILPVQHDLVDMFLDLAEANGMEFYLGTYDSGKYWLQGNPQREIDINKAFIDEACAKYADRKAFKGWYLTHEIGKHNKELVECLSEIGRHCKEIDSKVPTLISPYMQGQKIVDDPGTLEQHIKDWDYILGVLEGVVDTVAFQDGHVNFDILPEYLVINNQMIKKHGMATWSNLETFDRDMPFNFPPIDWKKLWWKMMAAENAGVEKFITFEFSHFMSPNSCWPAAKTLFNNYCDFVGIDQTEFI